MPTSQQLLNVQEKPTRLEQTPSEIPPAKLICLDDKLLGDGQKDCVFSLDGHSDQPIGRGKGHAFAIESNVISRKHALMYAKDNHWAVRDLDSTNGVFINDQRIADARLKNGDIISFGSIGFRFEVNDIEGDAGASSHFIAYDVSVNDNKTMLFRDGKASSKLLQEPDADIANEEKAERTVRQKTEKQTSISSQPNDAKNQGNGEEVDPPKEKTPLFKQVLYACCFLILIGAVYIGTRTVLDSKRVDDLTEEVSRFVRASVKKMSVDNFAAERKVLVKIQENINKSMEDSENRDNLRKLLSQVMLLQLERDFYEAELVKKHDVAREIIASARQKLNSQVPEMFVGEEGVTELEATLRMMEGIVDFSEFAETYPNPRSKDVTLGRSEFERLMSRKEEDSKLRKRINMDLLSLPYLSELLEAKKQHLRLLDRWHLAFRNSP
jgi:pSer/pThr/pTyr-binding forkhead associated (FHA) protein